MLRLARTRDRLGVVCDQLGHPTYAPFIADVVAGLAIRLAEDKSAPTGVYHLAGEGVCTWFDFATAIFEGARGRGGPTAVVDPIPSSAYPTPVKRPSNSALDPRKIATDFGISMPSWRTGLDHCLDALAADDWKVE